MSTSHPPELDTHRGARLAQELASPLRRLLAFVLDLVATVVIAQIGAAPIQVVVPPDSLSSMLPSLVVGLTLGFAYLGFAPLLLGNTLGKWLFSLRIVGLDGQRITIAGWLGRLLVLGLWPINGTMVLWSSTRRHLGDRLAKSIVITTEPRRNAWLASALALLLIIVGVRIGNVAMQLGILRSEAWAAAKEHLAKQEPGAHIATFPAGYTIVNDRALFDAQVGSGYRRIKLLRLGAGWSVLSSEPIDDPSSGTSVRFEMNTSSPPP